MPNKTLLSVPVGEQATILDITVHGAMRRRLMDLGMVDGTTIEHLFDAPSGNPRAYRVRGTVIALRNEDAMHIRVREAT